MSSSAGYALVSILSAVYNEAGHIEEMIRSVKAQDYEHWELVFASDGSTDRTDELIEMAAMADSRIRLGHHGSKIGKAAAFNVAFEASRGEIIILLAGDDMLPAGSLATRVSYLADVDPMTDDVVAYFRLRTMSRVRAHDGIVLPRSVASHSGGTITLTRRLASDIFPIDPSLVSEDLWLTHSADGLAGDVRESLEVVLQYRIHPGNSNPRNRPFAEMSAAMGARHRAWRLLLDCPRFAFPQSKREELARLANLEELRCDGRTLVLLCQRDSSFADRAAYAAMSSRFLFAVRKRFFRLLSGRRTR